MVSAARDQCEEESVNTNLERLQGQYGDILLAPVDALEFTIRTMNCFAVEGIKNVGELVQRTEVELFRMPGFGKKSMEEVKEVLASYNLRLNTKLFDEKPLSVLPEVSQTIKSSLNYTLRVAADQAHSNCINNDPDKAQAFLSIVTDILRLLREEKL